MSEVKWLLVGTGDIVRKRVAAALGAAERSRIVGIVGGADRAAALAQEHGVESVYADIESALGRTDADAVYVATPVYRHGPEALAAIESGRHVLIEKPLGLDGADAKRIVDAARSGGVRAGCAYYRRCYPRFDHARRIIESGRLGRIVLVRTAYHAWFAPPADDPKFWRVDPALGGGGPLADMGSHMFDVLIGLFDLPRSVWAACDTLVHDYGVEDTASAVMRLADGAQVVAAFGWSSKTWTHEFEIVGSEARLRWYPADTGPVVLTVGREVEEVDLPNAANVHEPLVQDFVDAIGEGREPVAPVAEAAKTNVLLDAVYRSAGTGQEVIL